MSLVVPGTLGVLVSRNQAAIPPITEADFCRRLSLLGRRSGLSVMAFTAEGVSPEKHSIRGYAYHDGVWTSGRFPLPDIVYNRCLHVHESQNVGHTLEKMAVQKSRKLLYWSRNLPGKWQVYRTLHKVDEVRPFVPPTTPYRDTAQLMEWLRRHSGLFMKPQAGTHGKGTLYLRLAEGDRGLLIQGRDSQNRTFRRLFSNLDAGLSWINGMTDKRAYIVQPYLKLTSQSGRPFDVRALMQKDGHGCWRLTGFAVREGRKGTLTSNLHGGGEAHPAEPYLREQFGADSTRLIIGQMMKLSLTITGALEERYGRLGELGIDYGIDRDGNIWLLEVNSRPGRASFFQIRQPKCAFRAINRPLEYARYLITQSKTTGLQGMGASLEHTV
ncbi:YheC/YheD family protein [Paenibacillus kribbensis]|uniref:YheC/YheD family endospore coat-associated protein n=1 Tax=Paenibacillus kribbensis TaxID=172713 RepID=UPI002DBBE6AE|nr:YheC/YheD family protein [Paenibacillus kribbensis]MEC0233643.1 YheC/YheD family protein [Paenibacillus kribbensis]